MAKVELVARTLPVGIDGTETPEQFLAWCARVSNPGNQANHETAPKLLRYLVDNNHWSPFEMVHAVLCIETTRDIARQILRHRSFSFQEFSQRYAVVEAATEPVYRGARLQDQVNRQASLPVDDDADLSTWWRTTQLIQWRESMSLYNTALNKGLAKEVARAVLPEGLTPSTLYMSGSIRSWIHYVRLRSGNGTQPEHRAVATACRAVLEGAFPALAGLFSHTEAEDGQET